MNTKRLLTETEKQLNRDYRKFLKNPTLEGYEYWRESQADYYATREGAVAYKADAMDVLKGAFGSPRVSAVYKDDYDLAVALLKNHMKLEKLTAVSEVYGIPINKLMFRANTPDVAAPPAKKTAAAKRAVEAFKPSPVEVTPTVPERASTVNTDTVEATPAPNNHVVNRLTPTPATTPDGLNRSVKDYLLINA